MKSQKYQITLNREQARLISTALDFYSRIIGGQFNEIISRFSWETCSDEALKEAEEILTRLKYLLTGIEGSGNLGIGNICRNW